MASLPGFRLEDAIDDSVNWPLDLPKEQQAEIVRQLAEFYEPYRAQIELDLEMFEPDEQSWRDYRNAMWKDLPKWPEEIMAALFHPHHAPAANT